MPLPPRTPKRRPAPPTQALPELSEYESYYAIIRRIPRGKVMTYGDVANWADRPGNARRVGYALFVVSDPTVPWWRVLNARGEISRRQHSGPGGPEDEQAVRLLQEGVRLNKAGRIDLERYRYNPGARAWADAR
jgi:methylated-DNA-protein-cysteine methyltransferase-like protein